MVYPALLLERLESQSLRRCISAFIANRFIGSSVHRVKSSEYQYLLT